MSHPQFLSNVNRFLSVDRGPPKRFPCVFFVVDPDLLQHAGHQYDGRLPTIILSSRIR